MKSARKIFIYDDLHPEDVAMLQALYSRSPDSVVNQVEKVKKAGSGKFMSKFYVGYGHASIGDCGTTTIFIENVSMLAAKAIQDNPLYSGQEASTRYLDFSIQPLFDPYDTPASTAILNRWMHIYNTTLPLVKKALAKQRPYEETAYKKEDFWQNAINARTFDIMRAFLPLGTTTLLSWTTNLRQARDKLMQLKTHPLQEVRDVAQGIFAQLQEKYPNSFGAEDMNIQSEKYAGQIEYSEHFSTRDHFASWEDIKARFSFNDADEAALASGKICFGETQLEKTALNILEKEALTTRPKWGSLARRLESYGRVNIIGLIDFGGFKDLQRHRNGTCPVPVIDGRFGFHQWCIEELECLLPTDKMEALKVDISKQFEKISALSNDMETDSLRQSYLYTHGTRVVFHLNYSIPQMVYVAELRSAKTVHPTLRPIAQQMGAWLQKNFPGMAMYTDNDAGGWDMKRGQQTITEKAG